MQKEHVIKMYLSSSKEALAEILYDTITKYEERLTQVEQKQIKFVVICRYSDGYGSYHAKNCLGFATEEEATSKAEELEQDFNDDMNKLSQSEIEALGTIYVPNFTVIAVG